MYKCKKCLKWNLFHLNRSSEVDFMLKSFRWFYEFSMLVFLYGFKKLKYEIYFSSRMECLFNTPFLSFIIPNHHKSYLQYPQV